jgi:hypothetical protein
MVKNLGAMGCAKARYFSASLRSQSDLRPKLDRLTAELLAVLAKQWPDLQTLNSTGPGKPFTQSGGGAAIHLALLPLWDGSLQAQDVGRAKDSR